MLCADSHGRHLAHDLNNLQNSHQAFGLVKLGARSEDVLNQLLIKNENLKENDILVIMCGSNDVAKNEGDIALRKIHNTKNSRQ